MDNNRGLWIALIIVLLFVSCCCCTLMWIAGNAALSGLRALDAGVGPELQAWSDRLRNWDGEWPAWPMPWRGAGALASAPIYEVRTVGGPVTLDVTAPVGTLSVQPGPDGQVRIEGTKRGHGASIEEADRRLKEIEVRVDQAGDKIWVRVSGPFVGDAGSRTSQLDLTITVPRQTTLAAGLGVGRLQITGITGDVTVDAEVGEVILADVTPVQKLRVATRVAGVDFSAALAPNARYEFTTDVGKISLRLPEASAFRLDARSDIGDVSVAFPVVGRSSREALVGKEVRGEVGQNPTTDLYLRSRVGAITIR